MSSHPKKTSKITEFFSPKPNSDKMEGAKSKKRAIENDTRMKMSPKKAKGDKRQKDSGGKQRKRRVKKDTGVKRSCSAYIYFTKSFREELKAKFEKDGTPIPKANEVAKLAGERWKNLSTTDRKPFDDLAAKDRARYMLESGKLKKLQEKEKDPNPKPKRAPTAYFIFLTDFRKQMDGKCEGNKIPALAGEKWRGMSDADKAPYKTKEAAAKKEHNKAIEEWAKKQKELGLDKVPAKKPAKPAAPVQKKIKPKKKVEVVVEEEEEDDDEDDDEEDEEDEEEEEEEDEDDEDDDDDDDDDE